MHIDESGINQVFKLHCNMSPSKPLDSAAIKMKVVRTNHKSGMRARIIAEEQNEPQR
jgi:hypothetical protein